MRRMWVSEVRMRGVVLALLLTTQGCTLPLVPVAAVYRQVLPDCGPAAPKGQACKTPWSWTEAIFGVWTLSDSRTEYQK